MSSYAPNVTTNLHRWRVTISGSSTGGIVRDLVLAAAGDLADRLPRSMPRQFKIQGDLPNGTSRGAILLASPRPGEVITAADFTNHGVLVQVGEDYSEPAIDDWVSSVRSATGADIPAVVLVYW